MRVLITTSSFGEEGIQIIQKSGIEVVNNPYGRKITQTEAIALLKDIDGVIAGLEYYGYTLLSETKLKVISRCGSGLSNIDLHAARELGISVYNTPNGPTQSVAELTVGCLLALIRDVPRINNLMHANKWEKITGHLLKDMKVLLIGYGRIGKKVASILDTIGAKIFIYDPFISDSVIPDNIKKIDLIDGLGMADVISLHSSGEDLILGQKEFNLMKRGVYILNVARGGLIDEDALENSLISGQISGAWLDTFQQEPYKGVLIDYNQVILTPHIGSYTFEGRKKMELDSINNLLNGLSILG
jgi:D-3-phosphoglycerate dehydrogenase